MPAAGARTLGLTGTYPQGRLAFFPQPCSRAEGGATAQSDLTRSDDQQVQARRTAMQHTINSARAIRWLTGACLAIVVSTSSTDAQTQERGKADPKWPDYPLTLARQGNFFVNGQYVERDDEHIMAR